MRFNQLTMGVIAGSSASLSMMIFIILIFSGGKLEDAIAVLYAQKKLGGLISLGALINLPLFFLAIRKKKINFAKGILIISLITVLLIALLKIQHLIVKQKII